MKLNKFVLMTVSSLAAVAMAQAPIAATFGQGVARSQNNRAGEFNYEVVKRTPANANDNGVRGRFVFNTQGENANQRVRVVIERVQGLGVQGNVAEFGGMGHVIRNTPNGPQRVNGRVQVRVQDKWNPTPGGNNGGGTGGSTTGGTGDGTTERPRDTIQIRVVVPAPNSTDGQVVFEFAGAVVRGNLVVRSNPNGGGTTGGTSGGTTGGVTP